MILVICNAHTTNVTVKIDCYFLIVFLSISPLENEQELTFRLFFLLNKNKSKNFRVEFSSY